VVMPLLGVLVFVDRRWFRVICQTTLLQTNPAPGLGLLRLAFLLFCLCSFLLFALPPGLLSGGSLFSFLPFALLFRSLTLGLFLQSPLSIALSLFLNCLLALPLSLLFLVQESLLTPLFFPKPLLAFLPLGLGFGCLLVFDLLDLVDFRFKAANTNLAEDDETDDAGEVCKEKQSTEDDRNAGGDRPMQSFDGS